MVHIPAPAWTSGMTLSLSIFTMKRRVRTLSLQENAMRAPKAVSLVSGTSEALTEMVTVIEKGWQYHCEWAQGARHQALFLALCTYQFI